MEGKKGERKDVGKREWWEKMAGKENLSNKKVQSNSHDEPRLEISKERTDREDGQFQQSSVNCFKM